MFVCIVGTSRCGTTVLRHMMHTHPELVVFQETHWLPKMVEFFGTQKVAPELLLSVVEKTTWDGGKDLLSVNLAFSTFETKEELLAALRSEFRSSGHLTIQEFSAVLVRNLFSWEGLWGDKTPDYGFYMGMIQSLWPHCRFIHIIRDGLATALSMARHPGCQLMLSAGVDNWCSLSYDRLFEKYQIEATARVVGPRRFWRSFRHSMVRPPLPLENHIASWRRRVNRIQDESKRLREGTYLEVHYEDLIQDPSGSLSALCSFLGLSTHKDWLDSCAGLVRPRPPGPAMDLNLFHRLGAEDLVALNQHRCGTTHRFLPFPPDMDREELIRVAETAERTLQAGLGQPALDLATQMMTTHVTHEDLSLLALAHNLAIRASHQCGAIQIKQRWLQSASQYGFVLPDTKESRS